ncbi:MAG: metallophosphoesterase [Verrucomicrobiales bacterium]|nr:metallophosphoesterase [Verrucomicrobiales bacterium]
MKFQKISRRKFIASVLLATPCAVLGEAKLVEPTWLKIRHQRFSDKPAHRFVHFSDLHHKGDCGYLESVVKTINTLAPDFVCFTGDIMEQEGFLMEALGILSGIKSPMFGVPGNHDYWSKISFEPVSKCFAATGGAWLLDERREIAGGKVNLVGVTCSRANQAEVALNPRAKNILIMHYPAWVKKLGDQKFDLMLAGHSHGGQVRLPFYGAVVVPFSVDEYDMGLFQTPAGPLYVNPGIGYLSGFDFRFNCRPEITVIEI